MSEQPQDDDAASERDERDERNGSASGRRTWLMQWLLPVAACGAAVGLHAYFQVPKGRYQPRPDPEKIRRARAKKRARQRRRRLEKNTKKGTVAVPRAK